MFQVHRLLVHQNHTIDIKLDAYVQTAFSNDGLLKNSQSKKISLVVKEKKIDLITSLDLRELALKNDEWVVSPLAQNIETNLKITYQTYSGIIWSNDRSH